MDTLISFLRCFWELKGHRIVQAARGPLVSARSLVVKKMRRVGFLSGVTTYSLRCDKEFPLEKMFKT